MDALNIIVLLSLILMPRTRARSQDTVNRLGRWSYCTASPSARPRGPHVSPPPPGPVRAFGPDRGLIFGKKYLIQTGEPIGTAMGGRPAWVWAAAGSREHGKCVRQPPGTRRTAAAAPGADTAGSGRMPHCGTPVRPSPATATLALAVAIVAKHRKPQADQGIGLQHPGCAGVASALHTPYPGCAAAGTRPGARAGARFPGRALPDSRGVLKRAAGAPLPHRPGGSP